MYRLWLTFAQTATICLAVLFVVATLKPEWLPGKTGGLVEVNQAEPHADSGARGKAATYSDAVRKAAPAVVSIFTSKEVKRSRNPFLNDPLFRHFFGERPEDEAQRAFSLGSGVIISPSGYILTNQHVVEAADEIEVALSDGKKLVAKVVGSDPETDLAVLHIEAQNLPAITLAQAEELHVGDVVLAIGNPLGVGQTVIMGIVSALHRTGLRINTFENFIQTDAAINQGNSGGALVDAYGSLVGINTAILSQSGGSIGIGFAIPVSTAKLVMEQLIEKGAVTRGWVGVELQEITPELADSFKLGTTAGVLVAGVQRGSPADSAGIKPGDIVLAVDAKAVRDPDSMRNLIVALAPGKQAVLTLKRGQNNLELQVKVGKRPGATRKPE
ncbi:MAG: Do family serine endopeptidase [Betaproteobacteria bacterium]|nr:MAG: Do family serine endopeptidase [Betaproteobacteria bacterium]